MKSNLGYMRGYRKEEREGGRREGLTERQTGKEGGREKTKKKESHETICLLSQARTFIVLKICTWNECLEFLMIPT